MSAAPQSRIRLQRDERLLSKCVSIMARDLRLVRRRPGQLLQILGFFVIVTVLFPLGYSPELAKLRGIAPGGAVGGRLTGQFARTRKPVSR